MWLTPSREIWVRDLIGSVLRQSNVLSKCLVHPGENRLVQVNCQENMTKMLLGGGGEGGERREGSPASHPWEVNILLVAS